MPRTLIVGGTYEQARNYARKYGYNSADIVGSDINQLRGRHAERVIILGKLDEKTQLVIGPILRGNGEPPEVLYAP